MAVELLWECDAGASIFHAPLGDHYGYIQPGTMTECGYCERVISLSQIDGIYEWHHYGKLTITEWP